MYLHAITLGYAVPPGDFDASVHSVYRSAANIKLEADWKLLTLVCSSDADLPHGLRLETPERFTFEALQVAQSVICRDGVIRFQHGSIEVDLSKSRRWDCDLSAYNFDGTNPVVAGAWQIVWHALNERQTAYGAEMVGARLIHPLDSDGKVTLHRLADGMAQLREKTRDYDLSVSAAVSQLIGLGQGVTPTGDDLLVGYIAGLWCRIGRDARRKEFVSNLGRALIDLSPKTTDVSRSFLFHAALGHVSSRLADLAEAICKGSDSNEVLETANAAMSLGHTSGMDAVTGLLLGLAAWNEGPPLK